MAITIEEWELEEYKSIAGIVATMPVVKFGRDLVLV